MADQTSNDKAGKANPEKKITRRKAVKTIAGGITVYVVKAFETDTHSN